MTVPILNHDEVLKLHAAAINVGIAESRTALLVGIDPAFVATIPTGSTSASQILLDLESLNRLEHLIDGNLPLGVWLKTAVALSGNRKESSVFSDALQLTNQRTDSRSRSWARAASSFLFPRTEADIFIRCVLIASIGGIFVSFFGMIAVAFTVMLIMGVLGISLRRVILGSVKASGSVIATQVATVTIGATKASVIIVCSAAVSLSIAVATRSIVIWTTGQRPSQEHQTNATDTNEPGLHPTYPEAGPANIASANVDSPPKHEPPADDSGDGRNPTPGPSGSGPRSNPSARSVAKIDPIPTPPAAGIDEKIPVPLPVSPTPSSPIVEPCRGIVKEIRIADGDLSIPIPVNIQSMAEKRCQEMSPQSLRLRRGSTDDYFVITCICASR